MYRVAEVARFEIELFPESRVAVGYVVLAVGAEEAAVGVDHRRRVVVDTRARFLVDRQHDDHAVFLCQLLGEPGGRAVGDLLERLQDDPARLGQANKPGNVSCRLALTSFGALQHLLEVQR